jgi:hypothetical protein
MTQIGHTVLSQQDCRHRKNLQKGILMRQSTVHNGTALLPEKPLFSTKSAKLVKSLQFSYFT